MARITGSCSDPGKPENADFAIIIDFQKGTSSPSRVFSAASGLIKAFESLDGVLAESIESSIKPVMVLENIQIGSLKIWVRNALTASDDQSLKDLDWKPAVGKYFVRAKYLVIRWIDEGPTPRSLQDLREGVKELAAETDARRLPDYAPPDPAGLLEFVRQVSEVKRSLAPGDRVFFDGLDGPLELDLTVDIDADHIEELAVKETIRSPEQVMILAVKKPDYLGNSRWEFRLGKRTIQARMDDADFTKAFQSRKKDIRPGDALRCVVVIESRYGFDNDLISEVYSVARVVGVLEASPD